MYTIELAYYIIRVDHNTDCMQWSTMPAGHLGSQVGHTALQSLCVTVSASNNSIHVAS
jgi:hypothetical protein